jgi:hypothetical protein
MLRGGRSPARASRPDTRIAALLRLALWVRRPVSKQRLTVATSITGRAGIKLIWLAWSELW